MMMGTNDARDLVPAWLSASVLHSAIATVRSFERKPVVVLPPKILLGLGHVTGGDKGYTREAASLLNEISGGQHTICEQLEVTHVHLDIDSDMYLDAVHLSDDGQAAIARQVAKKVMEL